MLSWQRFAAALALAGALAGCATDVPSPNLGVYKHRLVGWFDDGGYQRAFAASSHQADAVLDMAVRRGGDLSKQAIVLDIDETSLSNWAYLRDRDFGITPDSFAVWVRQHNDPALDPTLRLYRKARAAGFPVFFITGRKEFLRDATIRQLWAGGYHDWDGLFLKPADYSEPSVVPYKSGARRVIESRGYQIILNVGDQRSDLEGGASRHIVKLPNPFYFIR